MAKQGEIDYLKNIGSEGVQHAFDKPFSADTCGQYMIDLGTVMSLLPAPPGKLLDLGVGTGWTSVFFAKRGYDVTGQDIAEDMISYADLNKKRYDLKNLCFIKSDYENMGFDNEFDCAVFYDSLHHSVDEQKTLQSVYKALKPGGVCITVEPGVGHAEAEGSKKAVALYGVTERDMPPSLIMNAGKMAGFKEFKLYLRPEIMEVVEHKNSNTVLEMSKFIKTFVKDFVLCRAWNRTVREMEQRYDFAIQGSNIVIMIK